MVEIIAGYIGKGKTFAKAIGQYADADLDAIRGGAIDDTALQSAGH